MPRAAMAKLPIVIAPDAVLKTKAKPVERVDDRVRRLLDDMLETMYDAPGIGLAAPQVGVLERVVVIDVAEKDHPPSPMRIVNPEIVWSSEELSTYNEGCLSLPEHYADVTRPSRVRVRYLDETGTAREVEADGLLATCLQHEIDHLDGVLFIDRLSMLKRNMILRKLQKAKRSQASA
jgi:peptide deformylase